MLVKKIWLSSTLNIYFNDKFNLENSYLTRGLTIIGLNRVKNKSHQTNLLTLILGFSGFGGSFCRFSNMARKFLVVFNDACISSDSGIIIVFS